MSAHDFTNELKRRGLLAERLMSSLRETLAESQHPLSARDVATFLVQKQQLTEQQATDALNALVVRGIDVDSVPSLGAPEPTIISDVIIEPDHGSIFAPFISPNALPLGESKTTPRKPPEPPRDDPNDELTLAILEEDEFIDAGVLNAADEPQEEELPGVEPISSETESEDIALELLPEDYQVEHTATLVPPLFTPTPERSVPQSAGDPARAEQARRKIKHPQKRKSDFDSPLILIGGGALILLLLCGVTVFLLLRNRSGEDTLQLAEKAADAGDYGQSIELYKDFLERFKGHADYSEARVKLATLQIRRDFQSGDIDRAIANAQTELPVIEQEDKFAEVAQPELAALLPRIAQRFAERADAAPDLEAATKSIEQANVALELSANARYVPDAIRSQAQLDEVKATLARIERRQQTQKDLSQTIAAMSNAIESGDTNAAYALHRKLTLERPELATDPSLVAALSQTTTAERDRVKFVAEAKAAETNELPTPWVAALAVGVRRTIATGSEGGTAAVCVNVEGALYGLDVTTGKLLWRRYVGFGKRDEPASAPTPIGGDAVVIDSAGQALLRLNASTGDLRWRLQLDGPCASPLIVGERAYLSAQSGRLYVVDLTSGASTGYLQFSQPLLTTPAVDRQARRLYLTGERASLYCLSLSDLSCQSVYYLGHSKGSVRVSPAALQSKLAVVENDGVETCRLRLFAFDEQGAVTKQVAERRLVGQATSPPLVAGRRTIVVTDRGQLEAYDIGVADEDVPLSVVASRNATGTQPLVRYAAVADRTLWIGDQQLTKHEILPTGNRLPVVSLDNDYRGATFDHPLQVIGRTLVQVIRPKGKAGALAAGVDMQGGRVLWETSLAIPPAGAPLVDAASQTLTAANAVGNVFRLDATAIRARVIDQPLVAPQTPAQLRPLNAVVDLGSGRAAYAAADGDRILLVDPTQSARQVQWITLPGPLACPIVRLGDGILAPLALGQVLYLNAIDGKQMATAFQPRIEPGSKSQYTTPAVVPGPARQDISSSTDTKFVITDGREKVFLVTLGDSSKSQLQVIAEAAVGPDPIVSPLVISGAAFGVTRHGQLVRFRLPSLTPAGETQLPAPVIWGPYPTRYGDPVVNGVLLATAAGQLMLIGGDGEVAWSKPLEHGDLVGPPLMTDAEIVIASRQGVIERRAKADGQVAGKVDLAQSVDTGPVLFAGRIVVAAHDGTLLVVERP